MTAGDSLVGGPVAPMTAGTTPVPGPGDEILRAADLRVLLPGGLPAVDGINLTVRRGEIVGLAGESGSGKTMSALALFGLTPHGSRTEGRLELAGRDVLGLPEKALRSLRGNEVAMVFQDPMTALHPMLTIGRQVTEHLRYHKKVSRRDADVRAVELLRQVRIPDPERALRSYPHQLSGGMRQRAAIAIALACSPSLLVADEPTTALDVTVQAGILRLLDRLRREEDLSILLITHDLGVMSALTDRLAVMYAGRIVETGPTRDVLTRPRHPYTRGLLDSLPRPEGEAAELTPIGGAPPRLGAVPSGCAFHPRCAFAVESCSVTRPELLPLPAPSGVTGVAGVTEVTGGVGGAEGTSGTSSARSPGARLPDGRSSDGRLSACPVDPLAEVTS